MPRVGNQFEFMAPAGWRESIEGDRYTYCGPRGEQLGVSAWVVEGRGSDSEKASILAQLRSNALQAVQEAANNPSFKTLKSLSEETGACDLPCWTVVTGTNDRSMILSQAVIACGRGVMLVTLQGPWSGDSVRQMQDFLKRVRLKSERAPA